MLPKLSQPLTKSIRTAEFWLVAVALAVLGVLPIIQGGLSPALSAKLGSGITAVYVVSRAVVKGVAVFGAQTGLAPLGNAKTQQTVVSDAGALAALGVRVLDPAQGPLESSVKPDPAPPAHA